MSHAILGSNRRYGSGLPALSCFLYCRVSARQPRSPSTGLRTGFLFRQNDPKPLTPRPASFNELDARHGRASQLAGLKQGSLGHERVHPEGRAAGVGPWEANIEGPR